MMSDENFELLRSTLKKIRDESAKIENDFATQLEKGKPSHNPTQLKLPDGFKQNIIFNHTPSNPSHDPNFSFILNPNRFTKK